jgi:MFS family permease
MVIYGISYGLLGPAQSALLTVLLPGELLPAGNGALQTFRQGMRLISPIVGAGIFAWRGGACVAVIDAATFAIAAFTLVLVRVKEVRPQPREVHWSREAIAGIQHVLGVPVLRQVVIATVLTVLVVGFGETLTFAVVTEGLHRPPPFVGVLLSFQGIGGIIGGLSAAALMRRTGEGVLCGIGLACFAVGIPMWAVPSLPVIVAGILLLGVSLPWVIVAIMTLIQRMTPPELQGRAASALDLMIGVPQTVSIAVGATIAAVVNYQLLLVLMGGIVGVAGVYLLTRKDQWQRVPKPEPAGAASA